MSTLKALVEAYREPLEEAVAAVMPVIARGKLRATEAEDRKLSEALRAITAKLALDRVNEAAAAGDVRLLAQAAQVVFAGAQAAAASDKAPKASPAPGLVESALAFLKARREVLIDLVTEARSIWDAATHEPSTADEAPVFAALRRARETHAETSAERGSV